MSVYLLQNHPIKLNFNKFMSEEAPPDYKFKSVQNLILQDKTLLATGTPGTISDKQFPWNVLMLLNADSVEENFGFNLRVSVEFDPEPTYGLPETGVKVSGDFTPLLKHVFREDPPTTLEVSVNILFNLGERDDTNDKIPLHVLASGTVDEHSRFVTSLAINPILNEQIKRCLLRMSMSVEMTVELIGKNWVPACLKPVAIELPTPMEIHDDERTRDLNKKLLYEKVFNDFTLVAENGFGVACHKAILQLSSPFFERMFQTDCQEMKGNKCKLDLTEEGLKALLDFVYCSGIEVPLGNSEVAMELLEISHELQIPELESKMKELWVRNADEWLDFDGALRVFLRCVNLDKDGYEELKQKAVNIIKMKRNELRNSTAFDTLLETNPKFAKEFLSYFI